ncbi:MAG TPA: AMP-binding protein [Chthoniobacteraceae bacterium]
MNVVQEIQSRMNPEAVALISSGEQITYRALFARVEAAAARLAGLPARVALDCPNGAEHVVQALAIVRAGKCLVPVAGELAGPERERLFRETGVGAIIGADGAIRELAAQPLGFDEAALSAWNPAFIRFSSGTTGRSKGVVLSHETLLERVTAANRGLKIGPADRVVWILPMAHHFAVSIMLYLLHGATTIIENSHLAENILAAGIEHGGTVLYGAPFHHAMLAAESSARAWPTLRLAVSTAATLPLATAELFHARFGLPLSQGLGVIEVGLPLLNLERAREKPGSVGRPLPDFSVRLNDEGELLIRGPGMLDAYLQPWRTREEILSDGWFRTGDLARIDAEGDIHLLGRSHSVINVAGLKCFPEEIEAVLCELPQVKSARVSGRPNPRFGAVPVAEIVPRDPANAPTPGTLAAHCRRALARYKVPLEFRLVDSIPLTPSGKIQR